MAKRNIVITEPFKDGISSFRKVNVGDEVDGMWGDALLSLSLQDIAHLMSGGQLYATVCSEYAVVIEYVGDKNKDE